MDTRRSTAAALALVVATLGSGCDSISSLCNTPNEAIIVSARVDNNDINTRLEIAFNDEDDDSGISRSFCADDTVEVNGQETTKIRRPSGNIVFAMNLDEPASSYAITITHDGTPTELMATPVAPALSLTAPETGGEWSRGLALPIAWEPALGADEEVTVIVGDIIGGNPCLRSLFSAVSPDTGSYELAADSLTVKDGKFPGKTSCEGFIEVIRLDQVAFEQTRGAPFHADSRMVAATERSVEFTSAP